MSWRLECSLSPSELAKEVCWGTRVVAWFKESLINIYLQDIYV